MNIIKCEMCGSNRLIKAEGVYQCEFCGTKYTPEEAKKLIVSGTVEVVKGNAEKERLLNNADAFVNIGDYRNAKVTYQHISEQYPGDYIGWARLAEFPFIVAHKTGIDPSVSSLLQSIEFERRAKMYKNDYSLAKEWERIISKHKKLKVVNSLVCLNNGDYVTQLDEFDSDIICCDTEKLNSYLAIIQQSLTDEYCKRLLGGELGLIRIHQEYSDCGIFGSSRNTDDLPYKNKSMNALYKQGRQLAKKLNDSFSASLINKKKFIAALLEKNNCNPNYFSSIKFIIGKNIVYSGYDTCSVERLQYSITEQTLESILQKFDINLYSYEQKRKAEIFIKNFISNVTNKTDLIESLSSKYGTFGFKSADGAFHKSVVSINNISFSYSIKIGFTYIETHSNYSRYSQYERNGQIEINCGIMDVYDYLQEFNRTKKCGLCPNCGCQYKGIFHKICSGCGQ